jgi:hypothetical protein
MYEGINRSRTRTTLFMTTIANTQAASFSLAQAWTGRLNKNSLAADDAKEQGQLSLFAVQVQHLHPSWDKTTLLLAGWFRVNKTYTTTLRVGVCVNNG